MEVGRWREGLRSGGVIAGSVRESGMKTDEVKGGIKALNGCDQENPEDNQTSSNGVAAVAGTPRSRVKRGQAGSAVAVNAGKRKTWKSDENPIQISRGKTESVKNSDEQCKELSVSVDGTKKSPNQIRRLRSEIGVASDKSPVGVRKPRHELSKSCSDLGKDGDKIERNSVQLRKVKSESMKGNDASVSGNAVQLRGAKSEPTETSEELGSAAVVEVIESNIGDNTGSDENCKEFGVCQEMVDIPSDASNADVVKSAAEVAVHDGGDQGDGEEDGGDELEEEAVDNEEIEIEVEIEKKSIDDDIKEVNPPEEKFNPPEEKLSEVVNEEKVVKVNEVKNPPEEKFNPPEEKLSNVVNEEKVVKVNEVKKLLHLERREVKRLHQLQQKPAQSIFLKSRKPPSPPVTKRAAVHRSNIPTHNSYSNEYHNSNSSFPETHSRLQSLVDLVMWKDISRSVFVFGIGTFMIISSSYAKDINISFISVMSYLGLVYLATIFLFKSIIRRGALEADNANCVVVVGEEEAIWVLRLVLPYLNELLLKMNTLFSGDPSTTIKLAVVLFVLARCGNSITIWTMAKVGFFGVFTVPKVCTLYSAQITVYAKFWVRRFRDVWESCTHKKALTVAIFLLVWNLSSVVARIWAAFVLVAAFRYYQQKMVADQWVEDDDHIAAEGDEETWQGGDHVIKQKKGF